MNKKRLVSLCVSLLIISLFSAIAFESLHYGHEIECQEEECPVCLVLQIIHSNQKLTADSILTSVEFIPFIITDTLIFSALLLVPATLVKQKVKLII